MIAFFIIAFALLAATVGMDIAGKRSGRRKAEADGEAHYILATGKAEAEKPLP